MKGMNIDQIKKYCQNFFKQKISFHQVEIERCTKEIERLKQINRNQKNQLDRLQAELNQKDQWIGQLEKSIPTQSSNPEELDVQKMFVDYPKAIINCAQKVQLLKNVPSKMSGKLGVLFKCKDQLAVGGYKNTNSQCLLQLLNKKLQKTQFAIIWRSKN